MSFHELKTDYVQFQFLTKDVNKKFAHSKLLPRLMHAFSETSEEIKFKSYHNVKLVMSRIQNFSLIPVWIWKQDTLQEQTMKILELNSFNAFCKCAKTILVPSILLYCLERKQRRFNISTNIRFQIKVLHNTLLLKIKINS